MITEIKIQSNGGTYTFFAEDIIKGICFDENDNRGYYTCYRPQQLKQDIIDEIGRKRCSFYRVTGEHEFETIFDVKCPHGEYCADCEYERMLQKRHEMEFKDHWKLINDKEYTPYYISKICRDCGLYIREINDFAILSIITGVNIMTKEPRYIVPMWDIDEEIDDDTPPKEMGFIPRRDIQCYFVDDWLYKCEKCGLYFCQCHEVCPGCDPEKDEQWFKMLMEWEKEW